MICFRQKRSCTSHLLCLENLVEENAEASQMRKITSIAENVLRRARRARRLNCIVRTNHSGWHHFRWTRSSPAETRFAGCGACTSGLRGPCRDLESSATAVSWLCTQVPVAVCTSRMDPTRQSAALPSFHAWIGHKSEAYSS